MKKILALILALLMLVSVFAGCGSQEETPASEPPAAEEKTEAPAEEAAAPAEEKEEAPAEETAAPAEEETTEMQTLRFVFPRSYECLDDCALHAAIQLGYFEEVGLDLVMDQALGTDDMKMLVSGQTDVAFPSPGIQFTSHEAGLDFISAYQVDVRNIFGFCVPADSDINSIADLKGKSIALGDASWHTSVDGDLLAAGVDPSEVEYVTAGDNRAQMCAAGQVDAVMTWQKEWQLWNAQGLDFKWLAGEDVLEQNGSSLCFETNWYNENKDTVAKFLKAYAMGAYFTYLNPAAALEITLETYPSIDVEFEAAMGSVEALVYIDNNEDTAVYGYGYANPDTWAKTQQTMLESGIITQEFDAEVLYTNELVEEINSFDKTKVEADAANYELKPENEPFAVYNEPYTEGVWDR